MTADALISPMPTYGPATNLLEHREALARRAAWRLEDASPQTIIRWAVRTFGSRFADERRTGERFAQWVGRADEEALR